MECHEDIAKQDGEDIVWQHGVLLHNRVHNTDALVHADYHFRRLTIWLTRGPQVADFLAVLRDKVARIVSRIDIKYKQNIRLPLDAQLEEGGLLPEPEWANFKQILAQRNRGQTEYVSESETVYSISKILGLFEVKPKPQAAGNITNNYFNIDHSHVGDITGAGQIDGSFNRPPK